MSNRLLSASANNAPMVAIVGRPNVGKSTLFNRLCGGHAAIVENEPGVTRDRRYGFADWDGYLFRVVDTGGLDVAAEKHAKTTVEKGIFRQAMTAVDEADLLLFVCDGREGLTPQDREAASVLRKIGKPILWVANKVERNEIEERASEMFELGAERVYFISATHGRGLSPLCDAILKELPGAPRFDADDEAAVAIRIAVVGRPNAGKSSLVNRLLGEERMIVDSVAGTTRDPIDSPITISGKQYLLIDTAGIRKRAKVSQPMEKIAVAQAENSIGRADVCLLMIDADAGVAEQDAKVAGICEEAGRALVICFNKLDLIDREQEAKLHENLERQLQFVPWAKVVFASAKTGKNVQRILDAVQAAYAAYTRRITTGALNRWFEEIVHKHPPSLFQGKPVKLYFIQQPQASPPTFLLSVNHPEGVHFSYRRYLQNQLREKFELNGTPVRLVCKARARKMARDRAPSKRPPR